MDSELVNMPSVNRSDQMESEYFHVLPGLFLSEICLYLWTPASMRVQKGYTGVC